MKRNKITVGKMVNTIEIRRPVTLMEWKKVRGKKATAICTTLKADGSIQTKKMPVSVYRYTPTNTVDREKVSVPVTLPDDPTDEEVLLLAKYNIAKLEPKFRDGMRKYSTPIFNKSGLKEMLPEILDLISYHSVAQLQWSRVHRLLDELCLQKPELNNNPLVRKMFEILGDKPLAVKKKATKKKK